MITHIPFAIYAGDSTCYGTKLGPETKCRCIGGNNFLEGMQYDTAKIYLGAGIDPNFPHNSMPLGMLMKRFIDQQCIHKGLEQKVTTVVTERNVWGSIKETFVIAEMLRQDGIKKVYVVSSWYQIPRIMLIWEKIGGFEVLPVKIGYPVTYGVWLEPLKKLKVHLYFFRRKLKTIFKK